MKNTYILTHEYRDGISHFTFQSTKAFYWLVRNDTKVAELVNADYDDDKDENLIITPVDGVIDLDELIKAEMFKPVNNPLDPNDTGPTVLDWRYNPGEIEVNNKSLEHDREEYFETYLGTKHPIQAISKRYDGSLWNKDIPFADIRKLKEEYFKDVKSGIQQAKIFPVVIIQNHAISIFATRKNEN